MDLCGRWRGDLKLAAWVGYVGVCDGGGGGPVARVLVGSKRCEGTRMLKFWMGYMRLITSGCDDMVAIFTRPLLFHRT